jgi:hypothetical protein
VRAREGGVNELAGIWVTRVNRHAGSVLGHPPDGVDIVEVQPGVDPLREQVERHGDDVKVAGAFAVAEEGAFEAVGAGQQSKLGRGHCRPAVVMGVHGKDEGATLAELAPEPLHNVGEDVGGVHLYRRGQV